MTLLALTAAQALTPLETIDDAVILIEDRTIQAVGPRDAIAIPSGTRTVDFGNRILAPGFVDIHIHGAAGHDVMEATPEALEAVAAYVLRHGTTSFIPTTLSAPPEVLLPSLEGLGNAIRFWKTGRSSHGTTAVPWAVSSSSASTTLLAEPLGIHLEGPFLSVDCRGVHPTEHLQRPSLDFFSQMLAAADGAVRILTLAPELDGAAELQAAAMSKGVRVAIGHSNASYDQAIRAIDSGAAHAVHVFNAMRPFSHRDPGILGAILTDDRIFAEVIADGIHVAAPALRLLLRSKSASRVALVTDGVSATGMPPGKHRLGGMDILVDADPNTGQFACRSHEGKLAGSVLTQDRAVRNMIDLARATLREAVLMASYVPARMAGVSDRKGSLRPGADADLAVLAPDGTVTGAMVGGMGNFI